MTYIYISIPLVIILVFLYFLSKKILPVMIKRKFSLRLKFLFFEFEYNTL